VADNNKHSSVPYYSINYTGKKFNALAPEWQGRFAQTIIGAKIICSEKSIRRMIRNKELCFKVHLHEQCGAAIFAKRCNINLRS
jgi:hypothetical protein